MLSVKHITCHPIKAVGRAELDQVKLVEHQTMQGDRQFAVAHEASKFDSDSTDWAHCSNFIRGAKAPELQAISITNYLQNAMMELKHPDHPPFRFNPYNKDEHAGFINWVAQFVPDNRAQPVALVAADRGMTDSDFASISILNLASLDALSQKAGRDMLPERFRGNFWLDGVEAWEERSWIGKTLQIGQAQVIIRENIGRCMATTVDPLTGKQDVNTLDLLENNWGHTEFGVYGEVIKSGVVHKNDGAQIL